MQLLKKFRNIFLALVPIMVIVLIIHLFFYKIEGEILLKFFIAVAIICIGDVLFLTGVDSTIMPMGELMVSSVNKASKFVIFVIFAVVFGFCATIAEPDVTILSEQIAVAGIGVSKNLFIFFIGAGVGLFLALGILKLIKNIELKYIYLILFALIFLLGTQVKSEYLAIAFDAGGATTGIITAPFLLAIASGISSKFSVSDKKNEVFGMVGLASFGPIIAVLLFFILFGSKVSSGIIPEQNVSLFLTVLSNSALAIIPIAIVFLVYDLLLIKLPAKQKIRFLIGILITFVGLCMFLYGIEFGIAGIGTEIGNFIATLKPALIILLCIILGFVITFTEPSVVVLSKQVQSVTKGNISYILVMFAIAISMSVAITLSALKIIYQINFFYIILIGYILALILMFFVPGIFTGLAFDSGGVASGPMTSAFVLPIMIALASQTTSSVDGFGLIGIVGMCPIVIIQILGLVFNVVMIKNKKKEQKNAIRLSYSADMYSNIEALEAEYQKLKEEENEKE